MNSVRTFAIVLELEEKGGFTVRVPSLPEIVTYGKDESEALVMAKDAIRLVLEDRAARGEDRTSGCRRSPPVTWFGRWRRRVLPRRELPEVTRV